MKVLVAVFVLAALAGFAIFAAYADQQLTESTTPKGAKVTVVGTISCLPHRNKGDMQTLECAIGLKTDDGKYYNLTNNQYPDANGRVEVTGYLNSADEGSTYESAGVIEKPVIKEIK
jgi:hypothetical protein